MHHRLARIDCEIRGLHVPLHRRRNVAVQPIVEQGVHSREYETPFTAKIHVNVTFYLYSESVTDRYWELTALDGADRSFKNEIILRYGHVELRRGAQFVISLSIVQLYGRGT
jgi:hypothetical protein